MLGERVYDLFERIDADFPPKIVKTFSYTETLDDFHAKYDEFDKKLTSDERYAFHKYTDEYGSREITYLLTKPDYDFNMYHKPEVIEQIGLIDVALSKAELPVAPRSLYRGMDKIPSSWKNVRKGAVVSFNNFASTSSDPSVGLDFGSDASPVFFEIITREGAPIRYNFGEFEYLLPRDTKYKILAVEENTKCITNSEYGRTTEKSLNGVTYIKLVAIN